MVANGGELPDLALQQQAGVGREQVGDALGGGVGSVGGPEGVVHVQVGERREALGELGIVASLAGLEAAVLEHQHLARGELPREAPDLGPRDSRGQSHARPEQLPEPGGHRRHGQGGVRAG